ncbi:MAG TPA: TonB-dependent receptor [Candidatus Angelobacter sp.]|nr:TonB-dependent receptor [Candidatus Angelobacter sp.]
MDQKHLLWLVLLASSLPLGAASNFSPTASAQSTSGEIRGVTRSPGGLLLLPQAQVIVHGSDDNPNCAVTSDSDGRFALEQLKPGHYLLEAKKAGFAGSRAILVDLAPGQSVDLDLTLGASVSTSPISQQTDPPGFLKRLFKAYADDWRVTAASNDPPAVRRWNATPVDGPPFPFSDWPYGGSVVIGTPWTQSSPLMQALWSGPHGEAWKKSGVQIYGWLNAGCNVSTSHKSRYANFPEAYTEVADACVPDQQVLYMERQPDTVQTDHFDWGFRVTSLYGLDYRFTTGKGYFSHQLLGKNYEYGFDPVMAYVDLYFPKVAEGMNVRIGRYISLPDIEAQLAPNNYTYSHSILYTFDAYTQTGINTTTRLTKHWMLQLGLSAGNDVAPWVGEPDAKPTFNGCVIYNWKEGRDNHYACLNSLNSGKYAYNNLQSVYYTWYHKFANSSWHTATEWWYMWEKQTPNVGPSAPPAAASLLITGANGAFCKNPTALTCTSAEQAVVNYVEKQFSKHNYLTIRNELVDDKEGQRTGTKTKYSEHLLGWGHWIGTTILLRPELRFEHSYDRPAYDSPCLPCGLPGTKESQLTLASDAIFFF